MPKRSAYRRVVTAKLAQVEVAGKTPGPRAHVSTASGGLGREHQQGRVDRRDHKPEPGVPHVDELEEVWWDVCLHCGDRIDGIYHRESGGHYWRHRRRWHREPRR